MYYIKIILVFLILLKNPRTGNFLRDTVIQERTKKLCQKAAHSSAKRKSRKAQSRKSANEKSQESQLSVDEDGLVSVADWQYYWWWFSFCNLC